MKVRGWVYSLAERRLQPLGTRTAAEARTAARPLAFPLPSADAR